MGRTTSLTNWDFEQFHVQNELQGNDFVNAATTLIAAGPPRLSNASGRSDTASVEDLNDFAFPIGVVENISMGQNRQLQRIFEIGSKRSYFIPGRNVGSISIARTMFHGPSLMRVLYAYYPASKINSSVGSLAEVSDFRVDKIRNQPGFADAFMNLDSDLFDRPFGLMLLFKDSSDSNYAGVYLESAYINNHQINISSSSVLIAEGVTIQYDQAIPIDVGAVLRSQISRNLANEVSSLVESAGGLF